MNKIIVLTRKFMNNLNNYSRKLFEPEIKYSNRNIKIYKE